MKLPLLPYQARRLRSIERHRENLRDRLTRAPLDVAWAHRGETVLHAMMVAEARRRRGDLRLIDEIQFGDAA